MRSLKELVKIHSKKPKDGKEKNSEGSAKKNRMIRFIGGRKKSSTDTPGTSDTETTKHKSRFGKVKNLFKRDKSETKESTTPTDDTHKTSVMRRFKDKIKNKLAKSPEKKNKEELKLDVAEELNKRIDFKSILEMCKNLFTRNKDKVGAADVISELSGIDVVSKSTRTKIREFLDKHAIFKVPKIDFSAIAHRHGEIPEKVLRRIVKKALRDLIIFYMEEVGLGTVLSLAVPELLPVVCIVLAVTIIFLVYKLYKEYKLAIASIAYEKELAATEAAKLESNDTDNKLEDKLENTPENANVTTDHQVIGRETEI